MSSTITNYFLDNDDLQFQFKHGLPWKELIELTEANYTLPGGPKNQEEAYSFYEEAMTAAGEFAAKEIAPRAAKIDRSGKGVWLENGEVQVSDDLKVIYDGMRDLGLYGLTLPRELGGSNCPLALYFVTAEILGRADVSVMAHYGFHGGIAMSMLMFSAKEGTSTYENGRLQKSRWDGPIREIVEGKAFGCMVLTEPGAGSDLGALRTRAVHKDGVWRLNGEKIFITSGQGQYQFVLAKTGESKRNGLDGLKDLSLFLVPRRIQKDGKWIDNVKVTKVEEKLGHHAGATVSLLYEDSVGELIGKEGQGFDFMVMLMNSARVGVGLESVANAESAYRVAKAYAEDRHTMGRPIAQHELIADKLNDMETWLRGIRALGFEAISALELSNRLEMQLKVAPPANAEALAHLKSRQAKLAHKARRLTPLLKYIAAEKGVDIARDAMQIHGGMGYINETGVHKYLRDALVMPIYEGTSQIQALMATKDQLLWAARDPAAFLSRSTRARVRARTESDPVARQVYRADAFTQSALETVLMRTFGRKLRADWTRGPREKDPRSWGRYLAKDFLRHWDARTDFSEGLLHAERLTRMLADVAIGKVLMKQAGQFPERRALAQRFVHRMSLRVEALAREVEASADAAESHGDATRDEGAEQRN